MNNQKLKISLFIISVICLLSCKKKDTDTSIPSSPSSPTALSVAPDSIAEITKDFAFAMLCISDIDQMMGSLADLEFVNFFYNTEPGTGSASSGTTALIHDASVNVMIAAYNKTRCVDGRFRDGTVIMRYQYQNFVTPPRYREPAFTAKITFADYKVDDWWIGNIVPPTELVITNNTPVNFNPAQTNLSWTISVKLKLLHPTDPNRDLVLDGTLLKTLSNTSDTNVYSPSRKIINWKLAKTRFTGTITGTRGGTNNYNYTIDTGFPLERNFACAISPSTFTQSSQYHPFVSGITTLTLSGSSSQITNHNDYGNTLLPLCDSLGTVFVNGTNYRIHF